MKLGLTTTQSIHLHVELRDRFHYYLEEYFNRPVGKRGSLTVYIRDQRPELYPEVLAIAARVKLTGEVK